MIRELGHDRIRDDIISLAGGETGLTRTTLHIDATGSVPEKVNGVDDIARGAFNGVAARIVHPADTYLPVIEAPHGIRQVKGPGAGFVIRCSQEGLYTPHCVLQDVIDGSEDSGLGGIEVFQKVTGRGLGTELRPYALRWRPDDDDRFAIGPGTTPQSNTLLVQAQFTRVDHDIFADELATLGAVSREWAHAATRSDLGGVIYAPWAEETHSD